MINHSLILRTIVCFLVVLFFTRCNKDVYLADGYNLVLATTFTSVDLNKQKVSVEVGDFKKQYDVTLNNKEKIIKLFNKCSIRDFEGEHFLGKMEILQHKKRIFVYANNELKATLHIWLIDNKYIMDTNEHDTDLALFFNEFFKTFEQKEFKPIFEEVVKQQDLQNIFIY